MSKERARRRAEREAAAAAERAKQERRRARAARRTALVAPLTAPFTRRRPRVDSALARQRRRQDGALLAILLPIHVVIWLLTPSWWVRGSALVLSLLLWPVLTVLVFDRRPTR